MSPSSSAAAIQITCKCGNTAVVPATEKKWICKACGRPVIVNEAKEGQKEAR
jgi:hypothetical protein